LGAGVAIFHGGEKFFNPHGMEEMLKNYNYVAIALCVSLMFEAWAVSSAVSAVLAEAQIVEKNPIKRFFVSLKQIRKIQSPTTKFVWYEDTAAFLGVFIALVALTLSKFVMPQNLAHIPDAIASIIIGIILLCLAFYLLKNNASSLTVQSAEPRVEEIIRNIHAVESARKNIKQGVSPVYAMKKLFLNIGG